MSYHSAHCDTDGELHTIHALLYVLDEIASDHLNFDQSDKAAGVVNLIRIIAERVVLARKLHDAEHDLWKSEAAA